MTVQPLSCLADQSAPPTLGGAYASPHYTITRDGVAPPISTQLEEVGAPHAAQVLL